MKEFKGSLLTMALWAENIVFVYNIDSHLISEARDYFTRLSSAHAHRCHLVFLTHHAMGMKTEWKEFISGLGIPVEFLHRDEFMDRYPHIMTEHPVILQQVRGDLSVLLTAQEIRSCTTMKELEKAIQRKLIER
ncbi:MAG: hypothetical protein GX307_07950 [Euryarchaeota archaeon]|nr:hypothetical protein [Euryarchaeota archaeon]